MKIEGNEKCLGFQLLWCSVIPVFGCYSGILGTFLKYLDNANIILMKQNFLLKHKIFPSLERMMKLKVQHNKYDSNKNQNYKYINSNQYKCISADHVELCIYYRGVFRALFNIHDGAFFTKNSSVLTKTLHYRFLKWC